MIKVSLDQSQTQQSQLTKSQKFSLGLFGTAFLVFSLVFLAKNYQRALNGGTVTYKGGYNYGSMTNLNSHSGRYDEAVNVTAPAYSLLIVFLLLVLSGLLCLSRALGFTRVVTLLVGLWLSSLSGSFLLYFGPIKFPLNIVPWVLIIVGVLIFVLGLKQLKRVGPK